MKFFNGFQNKGSYFIYVNFNIDNVLEPVLRLDSHPKMRSFDH